MKLVFIDSYGKQKELGLFDAKEEAEEKIRNFLNEVGFKSYYWRIIHFENKLTYDVGSHSEFFVIYFDNDAKPVGVWDEAERTGS